MQVNPEESPQDIYVTWSKSPDDHLWEWIQPWPRQQFAPPPPPPPKKKQQLSKPACTSMYFIPSRLLQNKFSSSTGQMNNSSHHALVYRLIFRRLPDVSNTSLTRRWQALCVTSEAARTRVIFWILTSNVSYFSSYKWASLVQVYKVT